jgi:NADPH2:quinone reductase
MDFRLAAAAPLAYQTAWRAVTNRGRLRAGETVLVTGASGGVSTAAIQIAGLLGARVIAVTSGPENVRRVFDLGADVVLDRLEGSFAAAVKEHTGGRGVDLVVDSVGEAIWADCLRCLSRLGRLVTYGATTGAQGTVNIRYMFWKQNAVLGSTMASKAEFEEVMGLVVAGDLVPVVGEVLPLDSIRQAHELLERGEVFGQLVLDL